MSAHYLLVDGSHVRPLESFGGLSQSIAEVVAGTRQRTDSTGRVFWPTYERAMQMLDRRLDGYAAELRQDGTLRNDGFDPGMGMFQPRDLTHRFRRVLEEKTAPLNATKAFSINTEVQPGMLFYEQTRAYSTGEAVVYRGGSGSNIPAVGIGQAFFRADVVYIASKAEIDFLEGLRGNLTGLDVSARKMRAQRLVIDELINRWTWNGASDYGLYGLMNHPYMDTALSDVSYIAATAADDIVEDFGQWANYAENESGGVFQPDTLLIATKLKNKLKNRRYGDNADKSLLDWMLSANDHIKNVIAVRELNDAGGANVHAFAFIRRGSGAADTSAEMVMAMTPTPLPPDRRALASEMFLVAGFGGLNQREVGDNLLVYVQSEA